MASVSTAPPPLPPKTRRAAAATVISTASVDLQSSSASPHGEKHVVKIRINPEENAIHDNFHLNNSCIRININNDDMNGYMKTSQDRPNPYFFYGPFPCAGNISSGQSSPSDTLDSGTCSDLDGSTPPPLPKKKSSTTVTVTVNGNHKRNCSLTSSGIDVDSDEDNISCDSLNSHELDNVIKLEDNELDSLAAVECDEPPGDVVEEVITPVSGPPPPPPRDAALLPDVLLQDIRNMTVIPTTAITKTAPVLTNHVPKSQIVQERTYEDRKFENEAKERKESVTYDADRYYDFHLNENLDPAVNSSVPDQEETFAGIKDYLESHRSTSATIRSSKGTVRGVKNRVRAGIATFLQVHSDKNFKEKEVGKVIVYTTTMGVVRSTFHDCLKVKQILRTLMVKYEERDVMSRDTQSEIRDRLASDVVRVPQLFVEGQHIGDAETVERLNETGELRQILKPFKSADACVTCAVCGGYRLLPCSMCNGSKKSLRRNEFTAEFVALKCMNCDEVGLVKCLAC